MGVALHGFRLVRFDGPDGCAHHLLARAGRPSYPNYDQSAEDAADSLLDATFATLTSWCARWWLPRQCRAHDHRTTVVGEADVLSGLVYTDAPSEIDLDEDVGMRTIDVWVARGRHVRPGERLRVLFLTERSGEGDLRDV